MPDLTQQRDDPYGAFNFKVQLPAGYGTIHFTEVSGLGATVQAIKFRAGGENQIVRALPGHVEYSDVTLKYGITNSAKVLDWFMTAVSGKLVRFNVTISLLGDDRVTAVRTWHLNEAWPTSWQGSLLSAKGQDLAIETLTLVYESLTTTAT